MTENKKPHAVLLTDLEYEACLRICGVRGFSGWARQTLLATLGRQSQRRGEVAGGLCGKRQCNEPAWSHVEGLGWYCKEDAASMVQMGAKVEDHTPENYDAAKQHVRAIDVALLGLAAANRFDKLEEALRSTLSTVAQAGRRELLIKVTLFAAALASSLGDGAEEEKVVAQPSAVEPEPAVEPELEVEGERKPLPRGFLTDLEREREREGNS